MTIIQLEYLLAVANFGSFSHAADDRCVTQPSLSMQIKNLEEELGVVLLDRTKKPVIPTQIGEIVIRNAREALKTYHYIKESVCEYKGEISGILRLGVIPTIAPYMLHRLLPEFSKRYPKVSLEIREMLTRDIETLIRRDELDAAIVAGGTMSDGVVENELFSDRFYAYVSSQHPLFERSNIRIEDINHKELLLLADGHCFRSQILELCGRGADGPLPYSFESGSLDTLIRIVDSAPLLTIIPEMSLSYVAPSRLPQVKSFIKGAASRKIALASRRTYVKRSLIEALGETITGIMRPS